MARSKSPHRKGAFYLSHIDGARSLNWYICWFDERTGQIRRITTGTSKKKKARKRLKEHWKTHKDLDAVSAKQVRICDLLDRYYDGHGQSRASSEAISHHIAKLKDYHGRSFVSALTVRRQEAFIDHLSEQALSMAYIARILRTLRAALMRAKRRQEIESVPHIHMPQVDADDEQAARPLSVCEAARLLIAAQHQSPRLLLFCLLQLGTGARATAVLDLTTFQVDFAGRRIKLNPPGRKQETGRDERI